MTNKKLGNNFETHFCELLSNEGFWVHNFTQNHAGQPADVIAVKNSKAYLIDCKVCSKKGFSFSRIEENQDLSMSLWKSSGNGYGWFALLFPSKKILMVSHIAMKHLWALKSQMREEEISGYGTYFDEWVKNK